MARKVGKGPGPMYEIVWLRRRLKNSKDCSLAALEALLHSRTFVSLQKKLMGFFLDWNYHRRRLNTVELKKYIRMSWWHSSESGWLCDGSNAMPHEVDDNSCMHKKWRKWWQVPGEYRSGKTCFVMHVGKKWSVEEKKWRMEIGWCFVCVV